MRLYTMNGTSAISVPGVGVVEADEDGAFEFPEDFARQQHGFAIGGVRIWEDDAERAERLMAEELERRQDPATLLDAVERLGGFDPAPSPEERLAKAEAELAAARAAMPAQDPAGAKAPRERRNRTAGKDPAGKKVTDVEKGDNTVADVGIVKPEGIVETPPVGEPAGTIADIGQVDGDSGEVREPTREEQQGKKPKAPSIGELRAKAEALGVDVAALGDRPLKADLVAAIAAAEAKSDDPSV